MFRIAGNIFTDIRRFINEEKIYSILLIALFLIYAFIFWGTEERPESKTMTKLRQAQQDLKENKSEIEILEELFEESPEKAVAIFVMVGFFIGAIVIGLFIDFGLLFQMARKRTWINPVREHEIPAWGCRDVTKVVILFFAVGILTNLGLGSMRSLFFKEWSSNFLMIFNTVINDIAILLAIFYFAIVKWGGQYKQLGLYFKNFFKDLFLGLFGYLAILPIFMIALLVLLAIVALLSYEPPPHPLVEIFIEEDKKNPALIGFSLFLACVIGPIIEEIFFRGFAYPAFKKLWGARAGILITAAFFAYTHNSTFAFWPIFILGIMLAYLYEKRGSLIPSITMHILHNTIFIGAFFVLKRGILDKIM